MKSFLLSSKNIPELSLFDQKVRSEVSEFDGFVVDDGVVTVLLTVEVTQSLIDSIEGILPPNIPLKIFLEDKIGYYQSVGPTLLKELYVENTLAGITTAQSDQMMDDFQDVLLRIKEGLFPTAIYRLENKIPAGFVNQELIDSWKNKIQSYMG